MTTQTDKLLNILRELKKIDHEFPIQYAICLLEISLDEGLSVTHLAERAGLTLSTTSRIVGALSDHRQKGVPYELVNVMQSKTERRRKELFLTPKGMEVINQLHKTL